MSDNDVKYIIMMITMPIVSQLGWRIHANHKVSSNTLLHSSLKQMVKQ